MIEAQTTETTLTKFVAKISDQHYAMTGVIIASSAAQAAALGEACVQISLENQIDKLDWQTVSQRVSKLAEIKGKLLEWCNHEDTAITEYTTFLNENKLNNQEPLYKSSVQICQLTIEAARLLEEFRPWFFRDVQDDSEICISLLSSIAQAAILRLESNFHLYPPNKSLREEYRPLRDDLQKQVDALTPVQRLL